MAMVWAGTVFRLLPAASLAARMECLLGRFDRILSGLSQFSSCGKDEARADNQERHRACPKVAQLGSIVDLAPAEDVGGKGLDEAQAKAQKRQSRKQPEKSHRGISSRRRAHRRA